MLLCPVSHLNLEACPDILSGLRVLIENTPLQDYRIAHRVGISYPTLYRHMNSEVDFPVSILERYMRAYHMKLVVKPSRADRNEVVDNWSPYG